MSLRKKIILSAGNVLLDGFGEAASGFGSGKKAPLEKFRALLSHARKNLPAYDALCRERGLGGNAPLTPEEIKNIPPMTREDLAAKNNLLKTGTAIANLKSGGTGRGGRLETSLDTHAVLKRYADLLAVLGAAGWEMGQKTAALHPVEYGYFQNLGKMLWERAFSKMAFEFFQQYVLYGLFHNRENIYYTSAIFNRGEEAAELLEKALSKKPVLLITRPDALMAALKAGAPAAPPAGLKAVLTVGTALGETVRLEAAEKLKTPIFNMYASTELGYVALNCAASGEWLHINEADYFVETDPDGEILVTDFNNRLMPMLRYRTGDIGETKETSCACGTPGKSLRLRGRKDRFIENDLGERLYETSLINFAFSARLPFFQAGGGQGGSPIEMTLLKKDAGLERTLAGAAQNGLGIAGPRLEFKFADDFKTPPSGKFCFLP